VYQKAFQHPNAMYNYQCPQSTRMSPPQRGAIFKVILVTLLLTQALLLAYLSLVTAPNRTEVGHLGAAVYLWHTGKLDVFHVNPPLVRAIAGAPIALFYKPHYD